MNATLRSAFAVLGFSLALAASAQQTPIRILVGFPPGNQNDLIARLVADRMRASLGAPVIVENKPGVSGMLAAEALKNAPPDGRTLMVAPIATTVILPFAHSQVRYDPVKDFAPLSLVANFQFAFAVGPATPAKTMREYVAWVRANPSKATLGVPFAGGAGHFLGMMLARSADADLVLVPYKGGATLMTDLVGGQVPAGIAPVSDLVKHQEAGKVRILASFGANRSSAAPDVPSLKELGFPETEGTGWFAFHTTAGTPRATIDRLSAAIAAAIKSPEVSEKLVALGLEPVGSTPDELARRIAEDVSRWGPLIKASGFRAED